MQYCSLQRNNHLAETTSYPCITSTETTCIAGGSKPQKALSELPSWKKPHGRAASPRNTHADADRA